MKAAESLLTDIAIGLLAGLVATVVTGPVQNVLYRLTPDSVKRREERVRPGPPTELAAKNLAAAWNAKLSEKQVEAAATAIHYASGMLWGPVYTLLRRDSGMTPAGAAVATGASMSLILDESLTPALGFSAPDRDYPVGTHLRGFAAHLFFGAAVALVAETLYRLTRTSPPHQLRP